MKRIIVLTLLLCATLNAADLGYLVDMRVGLRDLLGLSAATDFYSDAKLNRFINRAVKFVQEATHSAQAVVGIQMQENEFRYALDDSIAQGGVQSAFVVPYVIETGVSEPNKAYGLSYKDISELTSFKADGSQVYSLWSNRLFIGKNPGGYDSLYLCAYIASTDMTTDSAVVRLPRGWRRELALDYAYKLALEAARDEQAAQRVWQEWKEKWQIQTGTMFREPQTIDPQQP